MFTDYCRVGLFSIGAHTAQDSPNRVLVYPVPHYPSGSIEYLVEPVGQIQGTIEQNLPQPFLKGLFWPLRQERGSKGAEGAERQHNVRLSWVL